jgi:transposase
MSGRRADMLDIREILRRVRLGESDRAIVKALGVSRKTVRKYRQWAEQVGVPGDELPPSEQLSALLQTSLPETPPPQTPSSVEPYRELVVRWREQGLECRAIWQRLGRDHGFTGGYGAVWRFVSRLENGTPQVTVRIEVKPGDEAQVDFGYVGLLLDPTTGHRRKAWAFVMTLSWSRHMYVEFVFDQTVETWLRLHQHAFAFFGAVPRRIVLDNLKAAVVKACFEDPVVQRSYRELAEHYGCLLAPCRVRTPEHKGKVESGVHYVQRNLVGSQDLTDIQAANQSALAWSEQVAGQRIHGTTRQKPLAQFQTVEQAAMLPLPSEPYDLAIWKQVTVGRDCYVNFEKAYYSAPYRLVGQEVWVRGGLASVRIYYNHKVEATHPRAKQPGERYTVLDHLPPAKVTGLMTTRETCAAQAAAIGPSTAEVVTRLLAQKPVDRLPMVKRVLSLADQYGVLRLERACRRALQFEEYTGQTIRSILAKRLDMAVLPAIATELGPAPQFARSVKELLPDLGGVSWN